MPVYLNKPKGMTPAELVKNYKRNHNISTKVCFAGRLDPMAHGAMILLIGDECKRMNEYCNLSKIYEFTIVLGFSSDTFDLLGKVLKYNTNFSEVPKLNLTKFTGAFFQKYPPYSSAPVKYNGISCPLWKVAKINCLSEVEIPTKEVNIFSLEEIENNDSTITKYGDLETYIYESITLLDENNKQNFRVDEILSIWQNIFETIDLNDVVTIKSFRAHVSSGTYIRSLADRIGQDLGYGALAIDIKRTSITHTNM